MHRLPVTHECTHDSIGDSIYTVGFGQANLDVTNASVHLTNCISLGTPKAFVVSELTYPRASNY